MASRKEQKEQARAARLAQEQEAAAKAQRTRRFQIFGGVTVIAVIVIVVAIVVSSGGGGTQGRQPASRPERSRQLVSSVDTLLNGIPQSGTTLGNPKRQGDDAPTSATSSARSARLSRSRLPNVHRAGGPHRPRQGRLPLDVYGHLRRQLSQKQSQKHFNSQQIAAYAAGKQNKFWHYAELFYHQQETEGTGYADEAFLTGLAKQIPGLNLQTWQADRSDPALKAQLKADNDYANKAALGGTPTLIMSGKKGTEEVSGTTTMTAHRTPSLMPASWRRRSRPSRERDRRTGARADRVASRAPTG